MHKLMACWVGVAILWSSVCGQVPAKREEMKEALQSSGQEARLEQLFRLSESYLRDSLDQSIHHSQAALNLATALRLTTQQAKAYDLMGRAYLLKGNQLLAKECFEKGLQLARKNGAQAQVAHLLNSLGVLCLRSGDYEAGLKYLTEARPIWVELGDPMRAAYLLINIGLLQDKLGHFDAAVRALEQALVEMDQANNPRLKSYALNNLGAAYERAKQYPTALTYYQQALALKSELKLSPASEITTLGNIHNILVELGREAEAEQVYLQALAITQQHQDRASLQHLLRQRADALLALGQLSTARQLYEQSLELAQEFDRKEAQMSLYRQLAKTAEAQERWADAYRFEQEHGALQQDLYDQENADRMAEMQARYELTEMEKRVATLQAVQRSKELQLLVLLAVVALFVVALLALYNRYRLRRRAQRLMEQRNEETERQNQLLALKNQEIQHQNRRLEEQGHAIQAQNQQLQQSNEELGQLAYAASHDLREPLRTIASYLQLLQRRYGDRLDDTGQEFLGYAVQGASRLQDLLSDLLEYSRVGRMNLPSAQVHLNEVVQRVEENLRSRIDDAGAKLHAAALPSLQGYPTELYLLFQNLISNAIKFRRMGIVPEIRIDAREEGSYHLISVQDNGIGIEMRHQERVFQMFQRLHLRDAYEGTGVGLTMCQKVVRNHGGYIWFDSTPGAGTTFWIKLPKRLPQSLQLG